MRIVHVSDNHGLLERLDSACDTIIHSGDFLPSFSRGVRAIEVPRQEDWVRSREEDLRDWIGERKFLFVPGNHDFIDPCPMMRERGIDAHNLWVEGPYEEIYGFPFVPRFTNEWNFEETEQGIRDRLEQSGLAAKLRVGLVSILVAHSPIYGVLDRNRAGHRCGSQAIRGLLDSLAFPPKAYLCGHIHESNASMVWKGIQISNAATGQRRIIL